MDDHFAQRRAQEIALEAEAARAQHEAALGALRNERIRTAGVAALLVGAGVGLACFGASFLIKPMERVVYTPGPEICISGHAHAPNAHSQASRGRALKTPEEKKFQEKAEYKTAIYQGRIVKSKDGTALSFADGKDLHVAHWNETNKVVDYDTGWAFDSDRFVGDLAMCPETSMA